MEFGFEFEGDNSMLTFGSKLNRSYNLYFPFLGNYVTVSVFFNKSNTSIAFKTEPRFNDNENKINVTNYKDLKQSIFSSTFLDIRDFKSDNLDIRSQFSNILPEFRDKINYISNESIKLSKVQTDNGSFDNLLYIYSFTFADYTDDFIYILAERQHIDTVLNKKIVRTSSIQICTSDCQQMVVKMAENYKGISLDKFESYSADEASLDDLFPDNNQVKYRKL